MTQAMKNYPNNISRRSFMNIAGKVGLFGSASAFVPGLAGASALAAQNSSDEYRALVCVFLYGGNDHGNTLIPYDAVNHSRYANIRQGLAISRESLASTIIEPSDRRVLTDNQTLALSPYMPRMAERFRQEQMAVLLNVGPLVAPLTRAGFESDNISRFPRPSKLFSHNDQQATWQSFSPAGETIGWGGRIADAVRSNNQNAMFTAINSTGNDVFLSGQGNAPYAIGTGGATVMYPLNRPFGSLVAEREMRTLITQHHGHMFEQDQATIVKRSLEYNEFINERLDNSSISTNFNKDNRLAAQLSVVARLIEARRAIGVKRQVFFVSLGGFDTHADQAVRHRSLLTGLDDALDSFYRATVELGVSDQVTSFTASDFGRTLAINGDGTDHGWGGHQLILGGNVSGGRLYGTAPKVSLQSDDQVGRGRLLPSTSVDEYSTTLALWLGVSPSDLNMIAPNIGRFASPDLGFMRPS